MFVNFKYMHDANTPVSTLPPFWCVVNRHAFIRFFFFLSSSPFKSFIYLFYVSRFLLGRPLGLPPRRGGRHGGAAALAALSAPPPPVFSNGSQSELIG